MEDQAVQLVPVDSIICRKQVRESFDEESLAGLAQSIAESGVLQPLLAHREGTMFILDDGERRLRAAKRAGLDVVPAIVDGRELGEAEVVHRQLVSNCQREALTPMERAKAIDRLMKATGWTAGQAAAKLGLSPASVSKLLALLTLPEGVQAEVSAGTIAASAAYELAKVPDPSERDRLASSVVQNGLSRDALAAKVRTAKRSASSPAPGAAKRFTAVMSGGRSVTVAGATATLDALVDLLEELLGKVRKARPKGVELDTFLRVLRDEAKGAKAC
jgi:ParB family chromosome partitioning protein